MENCDILVIIPLLEEFAVFEKCCQTEYLKKEDIVYYYSVKTPHPDYRIYCLVMGQTGPTHTAMVTANAIAQCHPRLVILLGIGGALDNDLLLGDVVIGEEINAFLVDAKAIQEEENFVFRYSGRHWRTSAELYNFVLNFPISSRREFRNWQMQTIEFRSGLSLRKNQLRFTNDFTG